MSVPQNISLSEIGGPDTRAAWLFGSHARRQGRSDSDIDVLLVERKRRRSFERGAVACSVYTWHHLLRMAEFGSLFVRHLIDEATPIWDPDCLLDQLRARYHAPADYGDYIVALRHAFRLVPLDPVEYGVRPEGAWRLARFLLRSCVYAELAGRGQLTFDMELAARRLGDLRILRLCRLRQGWHSDMCELRSIVSSRWGCLPIRTEGSVEAVIVNSWRESPLTVVLGLRLLNPGGLLPEYELLADLAGSGEFI